MSNLFIMTADSKMFNQLINHSVNLRACINTILIFLNALLLSGQGLDYSDRMEILNYQVERTGKILAVGSQGASVFLNGKSYYPYATNAVHPFFIDNTWRSGILSMNGEIHEVEAIKYDLISDYLVYMHFRESTANTVYLNKQLVSEFVIGGHYFRYLDDFGGQTGIRLVPGYYEVIYDGSAKFFFRREKTTDLYGNLIEPVYSQRSYLYLNGKFFLVRGRFSFLRAFEYHRKEIRAFMRRSSFRYDQRNIQQIREVMEFYDNMQN